MQCEMSQVQSEICGICHDDVIDARSGAGGVATGSLKTSCGHIFHPNCLWKWYSSQEHSNCPMCRAPATQSEQALGEEEASFDDGGLIRITRVAMEGLLQSQGGIGVTAGVEAELPFDMNGEVTITRYEFARIMAEQGATALTDESWIQLMSTFPAGDELFGVAEMPPEAVQVPLVEPEEEPRLTFTRAQVENFLRAMGSSCTVTEFFNEEDGEEETLVVTMTHASLAARLSSIVGREVEDPARRSLILNPEDELEV
ncbi:MAG: E3 ubiquitin-protein ligase [Betaproteobacteria bacterium]|nr:E3 ubiquitin-protein ligase [Betaproteobacteria bacterium]